MLLAVAGLNVDDIRERTRKLADGDWSEFPPIEALAYSFAHRLTKEPAKISDQDVGTLTQTFGAHRATDLIWYTAWCNYMTRVADAFQLPLEQENVFSPPATDAAQEHPNEGAKQED